MKSHPQNIVEKLVPKAFTNKAFYKYPFIRFIFIVYSSQGLPKYIEIKVLTTCFSIIQSLLKNKKRSETSASVSFPSDF